MEVFIVIVVHMVIVQNSKQQQPISKIWEYIRLLKHVKYTSENGKHDHVPYHKHSFIATSQI
jgi:hypothetical protein